jgi:hypothetical protein
MKLEDSQKEIQKSLGLPSKEEIEDMIKEKVCDLRDDINDFEYKLKIKRIK